MVQPPPRRPTQWSNVLAVLVEDEHPGLPLRPNRGRKRRIVGQSQIIARDSSEPAMLIASPSNRPLRTSRTNTAETAPVRRRPSVSLSPAAATQPLSRRSARFAFCHGEILPLRHRPRTSAPAGQARSSIAPRDRADTIIVSPLWRTKQLSWKKQCELNTTKLPAETRSDWRR
jgi:hypothetical protein